VVVIVWVSALGSGLIENIPFTAAMLPVVRYLARAIPGADAVMMYYGLSIGAGMGGNSSLIGSSPNLVTAGISERAGFPIRFVDFLIVGLPATVITVGLGLLWLFIHF
jgi:Na+/H+ antiporter NhaD/arsenite permease-like protein